MEVAFNRQSFEWGRSAAVDLPAVEQAAAAVSQHQVIAFTPKPSQRPSGIVADRARRLVDHQDESYADRYRTLIAALPEQIRGYGHVREAHAKRLEPQRSALRAALSHAGSELLAA